MTVKLIKTKAKEIFTRTKLPGAKWVINQYVGCEHKCLYCYAKFISKWKPKDYGEWGSWVEAKINAPELVKGKYIPGSVFMSSISDPYQPAEKELELTRSILENLDKNIELAILTKSGLVVRDIDLFHQFVNISVGLTINSFSGAEKQVLEPLASPQELRLEALKVLKDNNISNYAFVSPIIPGLTNLQKIIEATKDIVDEYWFEFINVRGAGREFLAVLKQRYPVSFQILQDKERFERFVSSQTKIIQDANLSVCGVVIH